MVMRSHYLSKAALLLLLCAPSLSAQVQLHGRVIDNVSLQPVPAATVILQNANGRKLEQQTSNEAGAFVFQFTKESNVRLRVDHIGYPQALTPLIPLGEYSTYQVEVRLDSASVLLAPLEVVARSRSDRGPTLAGFDHRRTTGVGWFATREEIQRDNPSLLTNYLSTVSGVTLATSGGRRIIFMSRAKCPAQIYIDGLLMNRQILQPGRRMTSRSNDYFSIDEAVSPGAVEGIELYQGISKVPSEFLSPESACGVVAIWTRRGEQPQRPNH